MEKRLIVMTTLTCFVMLCLLVVLLVMHSDRADACISPSCVKATSEILMFVDKTADPCEDFYQFACGSFLRDTSLDEKKSTAAKDIMDNILINQIKQMIEEPIKRVDSPSFVKTKTFYRACMNESGIDAQGTDVMKHILKNMGGWPTLDGNWKESDFDWKRATNELRKFGYFFDLFFSVEVAVDKIHEDRRIIEIKPPNSKQLGIKNRYQDEYQSYLADISIFMGATKSRAEREAKDISDFQEGLRKVAKRSEERNRGNASYNTMKISSLHNEILEIPWYDYISGLISPSAKIASEELVHVSDVVYIKEMLSLFRRAHKRTLANFMSWRVVQDLIDFLPRKFRDRKKDYMDGINERDVMARWKICLHHAENIMPFSLKDLFIQRHISQEIKNDVREMIHNIRKRFDKHIDKFDWLDENGNEVAKEKIASVTNYVADCGEEHEDEAMEEVYNKVVIREDKFLLSLLALNGIKRSMEYSRLRDPVVHHEEGNYSIYSITKNVLNIPIDYLHGMYYDINRPKYMNYGAIGSIIAGELSNMFLEGRNYDVRGDLKEWSTTESLIIYHNNSKCLSEQYMRFYVPEIARTVNSSLSHIQDIAEQAGKIFSYAAYGTWIAENGIEQTLPGIDFTQKQLMWISSALYHCSKNTPYDTEKLLKDNMENLGIFKVNGALRNIRQFAEDFDCPVGSKMNPQEKCNTWRI